MASSGVWENSLLSKTLTFDGVCGILSFIIILNISQMFLFFFCDRWLVNFYILFMTDVIVIL